MASSTTPRSALQRSERVTADTLVGAPDADRPHDSGRAGGPDLDPADVAAPPDRGSRASTRQRRDRTALLAYSAPATLWFLVFMLGPFVAMFYLSLTDWPSALRTPSFTGFGNFVRLFGDPVLQRASINTLVQIVVELVLIVPLGFGLGYILSLRFRGRDLLSVLFFAPILISASARAMMFVGLYAPDGFVNQALRSVGLDFLALNWLANTTTALPAIIVVDLWGALGFTAVMVASRLSSISPEIFEAAEIDGASHASKARHIALPIILDFVGTLAMLHFLWVLLGSAQNILLLTGGGPGNASMTLGYMLYESAFQTSRLGYSQAIGVLLFFIGVGGLLIIRKTIRQRY